MGVPSRDAHECASPFLCLSCDPSILWALHTWPGQTWVDIIDTGRLRAMTRHLRSDGREWGRFQLGVASEHQCHADEFSGGYCFEGHSLAPTDFVAAFHNTRLESLVSGTALHWPEHCLLGNGILRDQRLLYGSCTHNRCSGVNIYADPALETFAGSVGWVQLEVWVRFTTKLRGGRSSRYCVRGPVGEWCKHALVPLEEIPLILQGHAFLCSDIVENRI